MTDNLPPLPKNGGSRPVPDPTVLTTEMVDRAIVGERERTEAQLDVLRERLSGIDRATELRLAGIVDIPHQIDEKVGQLQSIVEEKFSSVATQFKERDTRSERESRDNKVAVDAAFAAQKEAAAKQDESNVKSIDKSETATQETINKNAQLVATQIAALGDKVDDLKDRVGRMESSKQGVTEARTERRSSLSGVYAAIACVGGLILLGLTVVGFILANSPH